MVTTADDVLAHYGIKGMKWGVRRTPEQLDSASSDAQTARTHKSKAKASGTDSLSNRELQELVNRMNLEQQYSKLNPAKKNAGVKFLKDVGREVLKEQVKQVAKKAVTAGVKYAVEAAKNR